MSIITVALPLSAGLIEDYAASFSKISEIFSFLLVRLSAIFKGLVFSISLVIRCMKRCSACSLFSSGVHVLLSFNGLSSSGL